MKYVNVTIRACLDSPQGVPFDLAPFPDQTEISAFGFARTRLLPFCSVSNGPYKLVERSFSTLKTRCRYHYGDVTTSNNAYAL